ncbi:methylated-DNA--[protein]-cysteine S-methyltransferase [uncultured Dubosiella sp.]|uniref:methylated-DNA--[protein]-cysteine S-methyltransferase n=4 Tax=uncultured Dubosiella sp. TaxID=1937011 RepID=UPI00260FAD89|nr:methylated-DNA--[protein]-cysteine S-methyltransferase [uncultured Dubosiella sp.]
MKYLYTTIEGLDDLLIEVEEGKLSAIRFRGDESAQTIRDQTDPVLQKTAQWLDAYFAGKRPKNEVMDEISATPFQKKVWSAACTIPYGTTWTYEQLAAHLGMIKGARAVGNALGANPLCLLVPCHRVIRKDGSYAGYNGGIENKRALLELEKKTEKKNP